MKYGSKKFNKICHFFYKIKKEEKPTIAKKVINKQYSSFHNLELKDFRSIRVKYNSDTHSEGGK